MIWNFISRCDFCEEFASEVESWFYILIIQENCLQKFKLPEPALCIGGFLQVELLGRVQRQEMDGLYYVWSVSMYMLSRNLS